MGFEKSCRDTIVSLPAFHDPVSAAMWVTQKDDTSQTLCFGTGLGYLIFWHQGAKSNAVRITIARQETI